MDVEGDIQDDIEDSAEDQIRAHLPQQLQQEINLPNKTQSNPTDVRTKKQDAKRGESSNRRSEVISKKNLEESHSSSVHKVSVSSSVTATVTTTVTTAPTTTASSSVHERPVSYGGTLSIVAKFFWC